jgi:hypothetical protein
MTEARKSDSNIGFGPADMHIEAASLQQQLTARSCQPEQ